MGRRRGHRRRHRGRHGRSIPRRDSQYTTHGEGIINGAQPDFLTGPGRSSKIQRYRVYGVTMASDYAFAVPLPSSQAEPDLLFEVETASQESRDFERLEPVYVEGMLPDGRPQFEFYDLGNQAAVRVIGAMDFFCRRNGISCRLYNSRERHLIEIALFGMVLSLWLELRGIPTLHASAVVIDERAVGFMSGRGGGKTTTAAACVAGGHALLTDDLLALEEQGDEILTRPGYPQLRLWPDQIEHFIGPHDHYAAFHPNHDKRRVTVGAGFGTFCGTSAPLARIYLPLRRQDSSSDVRIVRVATWEAARALVIRSFLPREVVRYGLQPARLAFFARLLRKTRVAKLSIPHGLDQLFRVVSAIESDLAH